MMPALNLLVARGLISPSWMSLGNFPCHVRFGSLTGPLTVGDDVTAGFVFIDFDVGLSIAMTSEPVATSRSPFTPLTVFDGFDLYRSARPTLLSAGEKRFAPGIAASVTS